MMYKVQSPTLNNDIKNTIDQKNSVYLKYIKSDYRTILTIITNYK